MNLYDYKVPDTGEVFDTILEHKNIKIVRIVSSDDIEPKTYIQDEDEWVIVLEGEALLDIDGVQKKLNRGESLLISAKTPHSVVSAKTGTLWLAVHIS